MIFRTGLEDEKISAKREISASLIKSGDDSYSAIIFCNTYQYTGWPLPG